ncbi:uncharacterized protein A1O9_05969 [Exophiala aquamarina CBS 119918]|uniref:phosphatidylinositol-3,4,5-trisphosphate 3-phosphatase n=1 Tax=Exophiala aquamarina CBS 119918 TaxID=1182545 RepID=A0A072PDV0_9EURO|nr:uncharacterized protein A1O9_05969 [Exophiala aquamarina CBS 119918]KEF58046.1 hypothetical protein A1O9_05969 [Exophiala aquamarina CBS 119918]
MAAMRNWIQRLDDPNAVGENKKNRVAVVHCKAGKGRSGTTACSYLISEEGWKKEDALERFTTRRMRAGFGNGVSIPSQLRWVGYVDRWANSMGKKYVERPVEVVEIHVWGLRDGVKVSVEGYVEHGRRIRQFHTFTRDEKTVIEEGKVESSRPPLSYSHVRKDDEILVSPVEGTPQSSNTSLPGASTAQTIILRPKTPLILPTSDINIDFERRNKASYTGFTMVTALAHVWFNTYFEGGHDGFDSGVFAIEWDAMDGIKGSARKGTRALDRLKVVWKYAPNEEHVITEPARGETVPENPPADWRGEGNEESRPADGVTSGRPGGAALTMGAVVAEGAQTLGKELGLRKSAPDSANISRASSIKEPLRKSTEIQRAEETDDEGVKTTGPEGEDHVGYSDSDKEDTRVGNGMEVGLGKVANAVAKMKPGEGNGIHEQ